MRVIDYFDPSVLHDRNAAAVLGWIHPARWLIAKDDLRIVDNCSAQRYALFPPEWQAREKFVGVLRDPESI
jgi:hypothetical protein